MSKIISEQLSSTLTPNTKRLQKGRFADMEDNLYKFVLETQTKVPLTDFILYTKANQLLSEAGHEAVSLSLGHQI
jgi:hypothetical protein